MLLHIFLKNSKFQHINVFDFVWTTAPEKINLKFFKEILKPILLSIIGIKIQD